MSADQIERPIRMPSKLYARLKKAAVKSKRSGNAEMLVAIERHLDEVDAASQEKSAKARAKALGYDPHRR